MEAGTKRVVSSQIRMRATDTKKHVLVKTVTLMIEGLPLLTRISAFSEAEDKPYERLDRKLSPHRGVEIAGSLIKKCPAIALRNASRPPHLG